MTERLPPNAAADWFRASEGAGDFMGIRYGRMEEGGEVEWHFVAHEECDGLGALGRLLREEGSDIGALPQTGHPCRGVIGPLWRAWRAGRKAAKERKDWATREDWNLVEADGSGSPRSVAWHLFSETETAELVAQCKRRQVTVNSELLAHLDRAVRPDIRRPAKQIPWMIPVNLRGDVGYPDDTANHVSCIDVRIAAEATAAEIQEQIHGLLARGEHRAYHLLMQAGRLMSHEGRVRHLRRSRSRPHGNIGAFSNLGVWDADKQLPRQDRWLFCPPCGMGQLLGAGCVTFQGRLGLTIQSAVEQRMVDAWMERWLESLGG